MRILAATAVLALTACTTGPQYQRPEIDMPSTFRFQRQSQAASIADLGWRKTYDDIHLQALLQAALQNNIDLKVAAARVEEARALAGLSAQNRLPQIGIGLNDVRQKGLLLGRYSTLEVASAQAQVSFDVDLWRRLASLDDSARAALLAGEYARDALKVALIGDVAAAYFSLIALDAELKITRRTIANGEKFAALTQSRYRIGAASDVEASRAEAALDAVRAAEQDILRQIAQTEDLIAILLGKNAGGIARSRLDDVAMDISDAVPAGLPASLVERRPDLREAEAGLIGSVADVRAAKAALFPSISLTGSYGSQSLAFSSLFSGASRAWSYGLNFVMPVIDSQRNAHLVDAAKMREQQALLRYRGAIAQAFREVSDALIAWHRYGQALLQQQRQVSALQQADVHVRHRYETGYSSYFEVLDSSGSLYAAQLQRVQAYHNAQIARVQLYRALGGGWADATAPKNDAVRSRTRPIRSGGYDEN